MNQSDSWLYRRKGFIDETTAASNPGCLSLSRAKLCELRPELFGFSGFLRSVFVLVGQQINEKQFIKECIQAGDSRAAVVMSLSPLLVAAYSDELDAVALLCFPDHLALDYRLRIGSRLLTINTYAENSGVTDLFAGPDQMCNLDNFNPTIGDFVSDDVTRTEQLKRQIPIEEWKRCYALGQQYIQAHPGLCRDGRPFFAAMPLAVAQAYERESNGTRRAHLLVTAAGWALVCVLLLCAGVGLRAGRLVRGLRRIAMVQPQNPVQRQNNPAQPGAMPAPRIGPQPIVLPKPTPRPEFNDNLLDRPKQRFSPVLNRDAPGIEIADVTSLNVGDAVFVRFAGRWMPGTVVRLASPGMAFVKLDDPANPAWNNREMPFPRRSLRLSGDGEQLPKKPVPKF